MQIIINTKMKQWNNNNANYNYVSRMYVCRRSLWIKHNTVGELTPCNYVEALVRKYDYVDIRFLCLFGVQKLCAGEGYSSELFCYVEQGYINKDGTSKVGRWFNWYDREDEMKYRVSPIYG